MEATHIQEELERIRAVLQTDKHLARRAELYAVQQALVWALDQRTFMAPYDYTNSEKEDEI